MNYRKLVSIVTGVSLLAVSLMPVRASALSTASMTLAGSSNTSGNFAVTVYENTGSDTVTAANVELSFSQAVSNVSYDYSVGPFTATTPSESVHNAHGTVTGQNPVATVHFTVTSPSTVTATVNSNSYLKHVEGTTVESFAINRGNASFAYSAPAATTPTAPKTAPKKVAASTSNAATSNGTVAGEETTTPETTAATDTKKKDDKKSDNKKADSKDANKSSSNSGFWLLAVVAVVAGYIAARAVRAKKAVTPPAAKATTPASTKKKTPRS